MGGRYLLSDVREGVRWSYFISGQNKTTKQNKKKHEKQNKNTELDYMVRM